MRGGGVSCPKRTEGPTTRPKGLTKRLAIELISRAVLVTEFAGRNYWTRDLVVGTACTIATARALERSTRCVGARLAPHDNSDRVNDAFCVTDDCAT